MRVTFNISSAASDDKLISLECYPEMTVDTLKSSIQHEEQIPPGSQHIYQDGQLIHDGTMTLAQLGVKDGDMLALYVRDLRAAAAQEQGQRRSRGVSGGEEQGGGPAFEDPEVSRLRILGNPAIRATVAGQHPELAAALEDAPRFATILTQIRDTERRGRDERFRQIRLLNSDPFDPEAQAKIAEIIRQERVIENLQTAIEHSPEVFGHVHMLYIDVEVNGHRVKALVDSGAQATIMSPSCAEDCGIMRLVDKRFSGVARGVGTANIIGRVHSAPIKIGSLFLPCSFTVMEGKSVELLLGLDMLKRHQACLDLADSVLRIQGEKIPFLGEAEIPREDVAALESEPRVPGPAGTMIGQRSGAISASAQESGAAASSPPPATGASGGGAAAAPVPAASAPAASASAPASAPAPSPGAPTPSPSFPREHINQLMALGATEARAIQALEATDGNLEHAAGLIFDD